MGAAENEVLIRTMGEAGSLDAMLGMMADDIRSSRRRSVHKLSRGQMKRPFE